MCRRARFIGAMGNVVGSTPTWDIYGRRKDNEKYEHVATLDTDVFSRWKHESFCYALETRYAEYKSLYLYKNTYARVAKAHLMLNGPYYEMEFRTPQDAETFDNAEEQMTNDIQSQVPWLFRRFNLKWTQVNSGSLHKRVFKKTSHLDK